jgi:hypothetical protein
VGAQEADRRLQHLQSRERQQGEDDRPASLFEVSREDNDPAGLSHRDSGTLGGN